MAFAAVADWNIAGTPTPAAGTTLAGSRSYTLDPALRIRSFTDGSTTTINHYTSASGDSPAWTGTGTAWSRNIVGIGGRAT
jgi:hypothetical protein